MQPLPARVFFHPWCGGPIRAGILKKQGCFPRETASIIANILSDPEARGLEFGRGSLLNFPLETAVKTGTSNDYNDAWTVGFNNDYTVGVSDGKS